MIERLHSDVGLFGPPKGTGPGTKKGKQRDRHDAMDLSADGGQKVQFDGSKTMGDMDKRIKKGGFR